MNRDDEKALIEAIRDLNAGAVPDETKRLEAEAASLEASVFREQQQERGHRQSDEQLRTYFDRVQSMHACTCLCRYKRFPTGTQYVHGGARWRATGNVHVCRQSARVHLCGADRCMKQVAADRGEGAVCSLTGVMLDREYSTAADRFDVDIRFTGNMVFAHPTTAWREAEEPSTTSTFRTHGDARAESGETAEQRRVPGLPAPPKLPTQPSTSGRKRAREGAASAASINKRPAKTLRMGESVEDILLRACGNLQDAQHVMQFEHFTSDEMIEAAKERARRRAEAEAVFDRMVFSDVYAREIEKTIRAAEKAYEDAALQYMRSCAERRQKPDLLQLCTLWVRCAKPGYNGVYYGQDLEETNRRMRAYFVECMLHIWEKLTTLDAVQGQGRAFRVCAVSILRMLATGFSVWVYEAHDGRPVRVSHGEPHPNAKKRLVEFIPKHPRLVLPPENTVRKQNPPRQSSVAANRGLPVGGMVSRRRGTGCRYVAPTTRRQRTLGPSIPSEKNLKTLYDMAISECATVDELEQFCLASFMPVDASAVSAHKSVIV